MKVIENVAKIKAGYILKTLFIKKENLVFELSKLCVTKNPLKAKKAFTPTFAIIILPLLKLYIQLLIFNG